MSFKKEEFQKQIEESPQTPPLQEESSKSDPTPEAGAIELDQIMDFEFMTRLVLGTCDMEVADILKLGQGSVLELNKPSGQSLEVWVNDQPIALAESVVVHEKLGARIKKIGPQAVRLDRVQKSSVMNKAPNES